MEQLPQHIFETLTEELWGFPFAAAGKLRFWPVLQALQYLHYRSFWKEGARVVPN